MANDEESARIAELEAERPAVPPDRERLKDEINRAWMTLGYLGQEVPSHEIETQSIAKLIDRLWKMSLRSPADGWREGAEAMREACAKTVEGFARYKRVSLSELAAAIRARSTPPAEEKTP
jgi:hypothetical protein